MTTQREKSILTEYIELYRHNTCLWNINSKEYMDENKKDAAYKVLLGNLIELDAVNGSQEDKKYSINVETNSVDSISNIESPELLATPSTLL
ncbi:hypothetical protein FQA39_LY05806 [Lamprigera yunnana]|nr:hypothetical protein FQA39_LY05806 [Lamprigera yunnana]